MEKKSFFILILALILTGSCSSSTKKSRGDEGDETKIESKTEKFAWINRSDSVELGEVFKYADSISLSDSVFSSVVTNIALQFRGAPYVANTLELDGEENLVINLCEFDCTTFVENVLAIANCVKAGEMQDDCFFKRLKEIRYRDGIIDQYPSRLHYFSEWLADNEAKGFLDIISNDFGNMYFDANVDFMSSNADKYIQLSENPSYVEMMKSIENRISSYQFKAISEDEIDEKSKFIRNGDVIAFCSDIEGLDIAHTAFAYYVNDQLHFIHASTDKDAVVISEKNLQEYLMDRKNVYGILVARPE